MSDSKPSALRKLVVPVLLLVGVLLGLSVSYPAPPRFGGRFGPSPIDPALRLHIVFAVVQVVLIAALFAVYLRFYSQTRANFALGLVVVLAALFLYTMLSNPFVVGLVGRVPFGPGYYGLIPDIILILAYSVFLYLSLE